MTALLFLLMRWLPPITTVVIGTLVLFAGVNATGFALGVTAAGYAAGLSGAYFKTAVVVSWRHVNCVGHFVVAALNLLAGRPVEAAVYLAIAFQLLRDYAADLHRQVVRPAIVRWRRCKPCARVAGVFVPLLVAAERCVVGCFAVAPS
jgi:hypothetical protein